MGSLSKRKDEGVRWLWPVLRSDEAEPRDQFVWWTVLAAVLLRAGYRKHCVDCARIWTQPTLLRRDPMHQPGQPWRRDSRRTNLPGKPELPHLPDDVFHLHNHG